MYVADADVTFCFASTRIVSLYMYTVPGQASTYQAVNQYLASTPPVVTDNYC